MYVPRVSVRSNQFFCNPADKPNQKQNSPVRGKYTAMRKHVNQEIHDEYSPLPFITNDWTQQMFWLLVGPVSDLFVSPTVFQAANTISTYGISALLSSIVYITLHYPNVTAREKVITSNLAVSLLCCQTCSARSPCVAGIPQASWGAFPTSPQPAIRFSQITSEWMVNTACLASAANRGSGSHADVPSHVSNIKVCLVSVAPAHEYLRMDNMSTVMSKHG